MRRTPSRYWVVLLGCLTIGCTRLEVKKVTGPDVPGIRYALPKPFIQVTPNSDGSLTVTPVYLPDGDNVYAISGAAYLAALTLDVTVAEGLLTKVQVTRDTSGVAEQIAKSAGAAGSKVLEAQAARTMAAAQALEAKRQAADAKLTAAEAAVAEARLNRDLAVIDKKAADQGTDEAAKLKAQVDVDKAEARLKAALDALDRARADRIGLGAARVGGGAAPAVRTFDVRGPVLFAVNERMVGGRPVVQLHAVKVDGQAQKAYQTVNIGTAAVSLGKAGLRLSQTQRDGRKVYLIEHPSRGLVTKDVDALKLFVDTARTKEVAEGVGKDIRKAATVKDEVILIPQEALDNAKIVAVEIDGVPGSVPGSQ